MRILVCVKQVPGTSNVQINPETGVLIRDGVESKMNPYDLYALETAFRIRAELGGSVATLSMGPPPAKATLLETLYMGADEAYLLSDRKFGGADVLATSYTLAQGVKKIGGFDLIVCGKQTTDGDTAQVGPEMAEFLRIPHITNVSAVLEMADSGLTVEMSMENAVEVQRIPYPCLITVDKGIYTPRLPSYKRLLELGDAVVTTLSIADMYDDNEKRYGLSGSPTQVERCFAPTSDVAKVTFAGDSKTVSIELYNLLVQKKYVG